MQRRSWTRIATGVLIILVGLMLLLVTTDTMEADLLWAWVPALFVLLGVWALVQSGFRNIVGPVMVIAIAGAFLLRSLELIPSGAIGTYWPAFVILFGVLILINRSRRRHRFEAVGVEVSQRSVVGVFSSDRRRFATDEFVSAEAVAIFGDAEVDLRDATVASAPAVVEATAIFGDVTLIVPADWEVRLEVMAIFGDAVDRRPRPSEPTTGGVDLVVSGTAIFADIEVRD